MKADEALSCTMSRCVLLLSLPLALQLTATLYARIPEGFWLALLLSVWASVTLALFGVATVFRLALAWRARRRERGLWQSRHYRVG